MAVAPQLQLSGPAQRGRGVHGQNVYAAIMVQPAAKVIAQQGAKQPIDFDRTTFREMIAAPTSPATLRTQG